MLGPFCIGSFCSYVGCVREAHNRGWGWWSALIEGGSIFWGEKLPLLLDAAIVASIFLADKTVLLGQKTHKSIQVLGRELAELKPPD